MRVRVWVLLASALLALPVRAGGDYADGEVRKVDRENRKITVKHGEIRSLDMPPMTMVFHVGNDAMLKAVKGGERIQFKVDDRGGKLTIIELRLAR